MHDFPACSYCPACQQTQDVYRRYVMTAWKCDRNMSDVPNHHCFPGVANDGSFLVEWYANLPERSGIIKKSQREMLCCAQMRTWEGVPDKLRAQGSIVQSREEAHAAWVCAGEKLTESWACKGWNMHGRPLPGMAGPSTAELSMTEPSMAGACMVFCVRIVKPQSPTCASAASFMNHMYNTAYNIWPRQQAPGAHTFTQHLFIYFCLRPF